MHVHKQQCIPLTISLYLSCWYLIPVQQLSLIRRDRELHLPYTYTIACSYNVPSQIKEIKISYKHQDELLQLAQLCQTCYTYSLCYLLMCLVPVHVDVHACNQACHEFIYTCNSTYLPIYYSCRVSHVGITSNIRISINVRWIRKLGNTYSMYVYVYQCMYEICIERSWRNLKI